MKSSIVACKECGGRVSTNADKCPHCGTPSFDTFHEYAQIFGLLFGLVIVGFIVFVLLGLFL